jgi:GNAT superfamily N-acetyltransferase
MENIMYKINDKDLSSLNFINLANKIWPRDYNEEKVKLALSKTINITAWDNNWLVGCVRILTDEVFFGTITEILVHPNYQKKGIGSKLLELVKENTPTKLYFGAQDEAVQFYEKYGLEKGMTSFVINK